MRVVLLAAAASLAAIIVPAAPALALDPPSAQFAASAHGVSVHRNHPGRFDGDFRRDRRDRDRRHDRDFDGTVFIDREWQGDTAWRANSFNDWWHERPWRSYPRWVSSNANCERSWQGGGVWRCEW
jgi:hypothetical protein